MRAATGLAALCANIAIACTASHAPLDAGADAGTPPEDAGVLEPCSREVFDFPHDLARKLCRDPLSTIEGLEEDGLPWNTADAFAPVALTSTDRGIVLEGLLAHRLEWGISPESPPLIAASVRYRIRLDDPAPFAALEEAVPIAPDIAVTEILATREEADCTDPVDPLRTGRLLCTSAGRWDLWVHAGRVNYAHPGTLSQHRPTLPVLALFDRARRELWWLNLQGLPDACEHEAGTVPSEPCRPELAPEGAWAMFAVPEDPPGDFVYDYYYCSLQLTCVPCCHPIDSFYECAERGFRRCDANTAWLDDACRATRLDDVPPPPSLPCRTTDEFRRSPCGYDILPVDDYDCP